MGNVEAKELICTTHRHELGCGENVGGRGGDEGKGTGNKKHK